MKWLIHTFGFDTAMRLEDGFTFAAGIAIGAIIMQHIVLKAFSEIQRDSRAKHAALIRIEGQLKAYCTSMYEYYESLWAWITYKLFNGAPLSMRNKRLSRILFFFFWLISAICIAIGSYFIWKVDGNGE